MNKVRNSLLILGAVFCVAGASYLVVLESACLPVQPPKSNTQVLGRLPSVINEASGLIASVQNPGLLWMHNDSGDSARLFGIQSNGDLVVELSFPTIRAVDWEDIALDRATGHIYIGDIGDNFSIRKTKQVYRFKEPKITPKTPRQLAVTAVDTLTFKYPDGRRDAEALFVHNGDLIVISKRDSVPRVYQLPLNFSNISNDTRVATALGTVAYHVHTGTDRIVAGDAQGDRIVLRSATRVLAWPNREALLNDPPDSFDYAIEPQGESLALDSQGVYTVSECCNSKNPPIYYTRWP
ncbi:hypothetical protein N9L24_01110 [Candidatus Marinamargulisbacteria bacterium]|jgi:hypothetical protein|nr:hypothetical protein [Candidatus Marinamargulisbacteria bacterium]